MDSSRTLGPSLSSFPVSSGSFGAHPWLLAKIEAGTFRLAWTQSFSRTRWLLAKVGLVGLASVAVTGLFSLMLTWWSSPIDRVKGSPFTFFDHRDIVPIGYAAFAFALGLTAGVLIRRTLPAMAASLVGFVAVRTFVAHSVRSHFARPITLSQRLNVRDAICSGSGCAPLRSGEFVLSSSLVNGSGHTVNSVGCSDGVRVTPGSPRPSPASIQHAIPSVPRPVSTSSGLSTEQSVLAIPVVRNSDLCRPRLYPDRILRLVGTPPPHVSLGEER